MKILIHDYTGHPFQVQLSRELGRLGHDVVHGFAGGLLTPRGELKRRPDDPPGLEFREYPMDPEYRRHKYSFLRRYRYEARYGLGVAADIRRWRPDLVVSGNTPSQPQLELAKATREVGGKFVAWVQDFYGIAVDKLARKKLPVIGALAGAWYRRLDDQAFALSSGVIVITDDFTPLVEAAGVPRERILVLPNWAPIEEVPVVSRENDWGRRFGVVDGFNFIYTGTLAMKHNPDLLLQLAKRFQEHPGVRVVVVSEGPGSDWLAAQRGALGLKNLVLLPFQPFAEMPQVLGSADVLMAVLEPEAGSFSVPSKVLTYLCAGRPILAAIPPENLAARIIVSSGAGRCVDPRNASGFVAGGKALHEDASGRRLAGQKARAYAEEHFEIGRVVERFNSLVERI